MSETKSEIRKKILSDPEAFCTTKEEGESLIQNLSMELSKIMTEKSHVGLFYGRTPPAICEPPLQNIWKYEQRHVYVFPRVSSNRSLEYYRIDSLSDMTLTRYGILEPQPKEDKKVRIKDGVICVPGLVFDRFGYRVGSGLGCYDRWIEEAKKNGFQGRLFGVCWEKQIYGKNGKQHDQLPFDPWDIRVEKIITEKKIYEVKGFS